MLEIVEMLQTLKYIILFLLGYKIIKDLFRQEPQPVRNTMSQQDHLKVNNNPGPKVSGQPYQEAELIDYEEVK